MTRHLRRLTDAVNEAVQVCLGCRLSCWLTLTVKHLRERNHAGAQSPFGSARIYWLVYVALLLTLFSGICWANGLEPLRKNDVFLNSLRPTASQGRHRCARAQTDALDRASLRWINAYNPGLSGAWMLQVHSKTHNYCKALDYPTHIPSLSKHASTADLAACLRRCLPPEHPPCQVGSFEP